MASATAAVMLAQELAQVHERLDLTRSWVGFAAIGIFALAYFTVMMEEKLHLRKSKPVMVAAGLIWALIGLAYVRAGDDASAAEALRHSLGEYAELFLFILVAMTFVSTMEERQVFDSLRAALVRRRLSLRSMFWVTGTIAFFLSSQLDNLTTALVMGAVAVTVGRGYPKFIALACINVVVAANAGGAWSAFGDITTLMVWQSGNVDFFEFYRLFVPSLVNWLVPAILMSFAVQNDRPEARDENVRVRRGGFGVVGLFAVTIGMAVTAYNVLKLPPVIGMTTGMGLLSLYSYYLRRTAPAAGPHAVAAEPAPDPDAPPPFVNGVAPAPTTWAAGGGVAVAADREVVTEPWQQPASAEPAEEDGFDIFEILRRAEWDTLMFFYGIILCVGGLAQIGYLAQLSQLLYTGFGPTIANVAVGLISAVVDNIPVMFAVLNMNPEMGLSQWLLVTMTAGVGGSIFSIGSAAGVALMGQARGAYTFMSHLKWSWAIALGYAASIWVHLLING